MSRRQRPRKKASPASNPAALDVPKTISPEAEEALWEMVFAMHLGQAVEDHLQAEKDRAATPTEPNQVG